MAAAAMADAVGIDDGVIVSWSTLGGVTHYTDTDDHCMDIGCILFQNLTNLDRSRFVRRDRSSPVKKNTQIFLVVVGVVIWFSFAQSDADHTVFHK